MAQNKKEKTEKAAPLMREGAPVFYDQDHDAEFETHQKTKKKKSGMDKLYLVAMIFFALVFVISAGILGKRFLDDRKTENEFADLQTLIATEPQTQTEETGEQTTPADNSAKFAALYERNPDFMGWISIDGTNLDFPVMYKPDEANYYLRHDFNKEYSNYGVPYLDEKCTFGEPGSNNYIIYGHNMKTGTIFGCLTEYKKQAYYTQHPQITFDTLYGDGDYTVYAAFAIDVVEDQSFVYNTYTDMDEETFDSFVAEVKRRSDVDSGYTPTYGDTLLTLSTCEYSSANGRYVVCAYKTAQ